jgi:hypothetical protein
MPGTLPLRTVSCGVDGFGITLSLVQPDWLDAGDEVDPFIRCFVRGILFTTLGEALANDDRTSVLTAAGFGDGSRKRCLELGREVALGGNDPEVTFGEGVVALGSLGAI